MARRRESLQKVESRARKEVKWTTKNQRSFICILTIIPIDERDRMQTLSEYARVVDFSFFFTFPSSRAVSLPKLIARVAFSICLRIDERSSIDEETTRVFARCAVICPTVLSAHINRKCVKYTNSVALSWFSNYLDRDEIKINKSILNKMKTIYLKTFGRKIRWLCSLSL